MVRITPLGTEIDDKEYNKKRKEERFWCFLKLDVGKTYEKLNTGQFTLKDFCEIMFPLSPKKQEIAYKMIDFLKNEPDKNKHYFKQMVQELNIPTSTAYQVYLSLKRAGIISRRTKAEPLVLSEKVDNLLEKLIWWWKNYIHVK